MAAQSVALPLERQPRRGFWFLVIALAFSVLAMSMAYLHQATSGPAQVPLKPCNTCTGCACPKAMGSTRCMCPN